MPYSVTSSLEVFRPQSARVTTAKRLPCVRVAAAARPARVALVALHCLFIVLSHGRVDDVEACNFVRAIIASARVQNSFVVLLAVD